MELKTDFETFRTNILPTQSQTQDSITGHTTLRARLNSDDTVRGLLVADFLQGSYRRATAVRPKGDRRSDVDVIIVSKLSEGEFTPEEAMTVFEPFLDKWYPKKWRRQGRSFGIDLSYVELDLVLTSAPSEAQTGILKSAAVTSDDNLELARDWKLVPSWLAMDSRNQFDALAKIASAKVEEEWKTWPLRIPDRDSNKWGDTHPLEQIRWTRDKNNKTNRHFINVVKAIKWWKLEKREDPKHPKGFPLERIIGECCPDDISSVAEGVTRTFEAIKSKYATLVALGSKPCLPDYGVPQHDVLHRISIDDFKLFHEHVAEAAEQARCAFDCEDRTESGNLWRDLFGTKFPEPPDNGGTKKVGYTPPASAAIPGSGRFA